MQKAHNDCVLFRMYPNCAPRPGKLTASKLNPNSLSRGSTFSDVDVGVATKESNAFGHSSIQALALERRHTLKRPCEIHSEFIISIIIYSWLLNWNHSRINGKMRPELFICRWTSLRASSPFLSLSTRADENEHTWLIPYENSRNGLVAKIFTLRINY